MARHKCVIFTIEDGWRICRDCDGGAYMIALKNGRLIVRVP